MITGNLVDIDVTVFQLFLAEAILLDSKLDKIHGKSGSLREEKKLQCSLNIITVLNAN